MRKTFRGKISQDEIQQIRLSTNNGLTGYQIIKFQLMPNTFNSDCNSVVKIFSKEPDSASNTVDFTDPTLIASAYYSQSDTPHNQPEDLNVIFDNNLINQDMYITYKDALASTPPDINYYIELEQVKLSKDEAAVATLKDMRAGPDTNFGP